MTTVRQWSSPAFLGGAELDCYGTVHTICICLVCSSIFRWNCSALFAW